jgi:hypothetical protein
VHKEGKKMARKKLQLQAYYSEDRVGLELLEVSL